MPGTRLPGPRDPGARPLAPRLLPLAPRLLGVGAAQAEDGNAVLEFVALSVVVLIPFIYLLFSVFTVQRASFGVTQAAREAGRVMATSEDLRAGTARAQAAAELALADQGVAAAPQVSFIPAGTSCTGTFGPSAASLSPGATFTVCVSAQVTLPYTDKGLLHLGKSASIRVTASSLVSVDAYRAAATASPAP